MSLDTSIMAEEAHLEHVEETLVAETPVVEAGDAVESASVEPVEPSTVSALDLSSLSMDGKEAHENGESKFVSVQEEPEVVFGGSAQGEHAAPSHWKTGLTPRAPQDDSSSDGTSYSLSHGIFVSSMLSSSATAAVQHRYQSSSLESTLQTSFSPIECLFWPTDSPIFEPIVDLYLVWVFLMV